MVRNYIKKGQKGKWNQEDMMGAIWAVKEAQMTVYETATHFWTQRETLWSCVTGKVNLDAKVRGLDTLSKDEEAEIVETCQVFCRVGVWIEEEWCEGSHGWFLQQNEVQPSIQAKYARGWLVDRLDVSTSSTCAKETSGPADTVVRAQCSSMEVVNNHWFIECLKPTVNSLRPDDLQRWFSM